MGCSNRNEFQFLMVQLKGLDWRAEYKTAVFQFLMVQLKGR